MRAICKVHDSRGITLALSAPFGSEEALDDEGRAVVEKALAPRLALFIVDRAPAEHVLTRLRDDVSKLSYKLRLNRVIIWHDVFAAFNTDLCTEVVSTVGGEFLNAWEQAAAGASWGGLGFRAAERACAAAFAARRVGPRPRVSEMSEHLPQAGLRAAPAVMRAATGA